MAWFVYCIAFSKVCGVSFARLDFGDFLVIDGYHLHFLLPGHVLHVILSLEAGVNGAVSGGEGGTQGTGCDSDDGYRVRRGLIMES